MEQVSSDLTYQGRYQVRYVAHSTYTVSPIPSTYLHVPVALPLATSRLCSFHSTGCPLSLATALQVGMCASSLSSSLIHHQYQTANIKISDSEAFH